MQATVTVVRPAGGQVTQTHSKFSPIIQDAPIAVARSREARHLAGPTFAYLVSQLKLISHRTPTIGSQIFP